MLQAHKGFFRVSHQKYCTDHYELGSTIVKAESKEEAMEKLNKYLATYPDGGYTALPCEKIEYVNELTYLE